MLPSKYIHKFKLKPNCWVFVPTVETITRGHIIKKEIEAKWTPPDYYSHLSLGGHISALNKHIGNTLFIRADIKQFFNSINRTRVTRELKNLFKDYSKARSMACESVMQTNQTYILPFGFVQSPIIASLCLFNSALGQFLNDMHNSGVDVTVYMDDIIISTSLSLEENEIIFKNLQHKAHRSNFDFHVEKTMGPIETISAFNINLDKDKIEITHERLSEFEADINNSSNINVIEGILNYVKSVSPKQFEILNEKISKKGK